MIAWLFLFLFFYRHQWLRPATFIGSIYWSTQKLAQTTSPKFKHIERFWKTWKLAQIDVSLHSGSYCQVVYIFVLSLMITWRHVLANVSYILGGIYFILFNLLYMATPDNPFQKKKIFSSGIKTSSFDSLSKHVFEYWESKWNSQKMAFSSENLKYRAHE